MPVYLLNHLPVFPSPAKARPDGLLAVGGDLSPKRLLAAYKSGIFPWFSDEDPILWWSPDPRLVLFPGMIKISDSLKKTMRQNKFQITTDVAFRQVITQCANVRRQHGISTWIVDEMIEAYTKLHESGFAHSAEAWQDEKLVGGLYGVSLGRAFFGESMFAAVSNASKVAFARFTAYLDQMGFDLIDCQVRTDHLLRFGAMEMPRQEFLKRLKTALNGPTKKGKWKFSDHA